MTYGSHEPSSYVIGHLHQKRNFSANCMMRGSSDVLNWPKRPLVISWIGATVVPCVGGARSRRKLFVTLYTSHRNSMRRLSFNRKDRTRAMLKSKCPGPTTLRVPEFPMVPRA